MTDPSFRRLFDDARRMPEFWEEGAILAFTDALSVAMADQHITRTELARRLGTSQAYVTRLLSGNANFTLRTMSKLAYALGMDLDVGLRPQAAATRPAESKVNLGGE